VYLVTCKDRFLRQISVFVCDTKIAYTLLLSRITFVENDDGTLFGGRPPFATSSTTLYADRGPSFIRRILYSRSSYLPNRSSRFGPSAPYLKRISSYALTILFESCARVTGAQDFCLRRNRNLNRRPLHVDFYN